MVVAYRLNDIISHFHLEKVKEKKEMEKVQQKKLAHYNENLIEAVK